jgi:hypothetical protein
MERSTDDGVLFRRWRDGEEVERFEVPGLRWIEGVIHVGHEAHSHPTTQRITRAQLEYIHLGPRTTP